MIDTDRTDSWVWLYKGGGEDVSIDVAEDRLPDLDDGMLLWADVDLDSVSKLERLWEHLGIGAEIDKMVANPSESGLFHLNDHLTLNVSVARADEGLEMVDLHFLVGRNWVVTLHDGKLDLIEEFNRPFEGDTKLGELSGPAFTSMVLEWQLSGYFSAIEAVQSEIDQLDEELLGEDPDETGLLRRLQTMRGRVRLLRRHLGPQREALSLLSHPETDILIGEEVARDYERLADQVQRGLEALDTTREMIVGTFDIFMTRTAQSTNDIMKRLTIVSVLLLPAAVIAGIMGMNFRVPIFDAPWMFWVTLGLMAFLAVATLLIAKRSKWI